MPGGGGWSSLAGGLGRYTLNGINSAATQPAPAAPAPTAPAPSGGLASAALSSATPSAAPATPAAASTEPYPGYTDWTVNNQNLQLIFGSKQNYDMAMAVGAQNGLSPLQVVQGGQKYYNLAVQQGSAPYTNGSDTFGVVQGILGYGAGLSKEQIAQSFGGQQNVDQMEANSLSSMWNNINASHQGGDDWEDIAKMGLGLGAGIFAPYLLPELGAFAAPVLSGAVNFASTGDLGSGLLSGLKSYLGGEAMSGLGDLNPTGASFDPGGELYGVGGGGLDQYASYGPSTDSSVYNLEDPYGGTHWPDDSGLGAPEGADPVPPVVQGAAPSASNAEMNTAINNSTGDTGGSTDWLKWAKENAPLLGVGAGLVTGGLQAYQNSRNASTAAQQSAQAQQANAARQAGIDNPAPFPGMNGPGLKPFGGAPSASAPAGSGGLSLASAAAPSGASATSAGPHVSYPGDLATYGQRPEYRFFNASGGSPTSHTPRPAGGLSLISGPGGGQDDKVPAMLSPSEYVLDADVVAALGDGNPEEGSRRLDSWREEIRRHKRAAPKSKIPPKAKAPGQYMRRAA